MKKFLLKFAFVFIFLILTGFKKENYKIFSKEIDGRVFYFSVPESFCKEEEKTPEVMEFVKCYEQELWKKNELSFFTERILIGYEKDDKTTQNITDSYFAKLQKNNYDNSPEEEKELYFYNDNYPIENKVKSSIIDNKYIFKRTASDEEGNRFITYQSNLFLNKRFFMINWSQFLTKNEKPLELKEKRFVNLVEKNRKINDAQDSLYKYSTRQIIITKPRFGNFANYTDIKEYNDEKFNGFFITLLDTDKKDKILLFRSSILNENVDTQNVFKLLSEENEKNDSEKLDIKLVKYKGDNFIKIIGKQTTMYMAYINFSFNISGVVSLELPEKTNDEKNEYVKYLYKYKQQLIKDNL